ncbi:MAG: late competence development ComFB family protein [Spirochaetaceae bacterium]|jgi:competence protein ComFB|nr:late competence development ComFB family protein [Spirochaetaceae bacterium]
MAFMDDYDLENLVNETEEFVLAELGRQLESYPGEICKCNDCVCDMATLALNQAPPKYRWTIMGHMYTESSLNDENFKKEISRIVSQAIEKVRKNPAHTALDTN